MGIFSRFNQFFGFTANEIKVILFLSVTFLAGLGVRWYRSATNDRSQPINVADYAELDSIFRARSKSDLAPEHLTDQSRPDSPTSRPKGKPPTPRPKSIDLNQAGKDQLMLLPGIGASYAERIILYRTDNGPFRSIDELDRVKGIGKKTIERLRPFVTLSTTDDKKDLRP